MKNDRFNVSSIPTKTTGFTPIVYTTAQGMVWRLRYSAGINWQLNRISYEDKSVGIKSHNIQWGINPTIQLMMPWGAKRNHALMFNYKRALSDIPYSAISSVINWEDSYNYTVGNPDLKAQSADYGYGRIVFLTKQGQCHSTVCPHSQPNLLADFPKRGQFRCVLYQAC